ncbi:MAG TPA: sugar transferase [Lachnospiraceae bacterium]|nr:sugar transferase [Lachnospiraceae bacterium]
MHKKEIRGWLKHIDFIILDIVMLQICFVLSYWIWMGVENPYSYYLYRYQALLLAFCQILVILFTNSYKNILRRGAAEEFGAVLRFEVSFMLLDILFLFMVHQIYLISRKFTGIMVVMYLFASFFIRQLNKKRIFHSAKVKEGKKSLMVMTSAALAEKVVNNLIDNVYTDYRITGVYLMDTEANGRRIRDIPTMGRETDIINLIRTDWVDEVFVYQPDNMPYPMNMIDAIMDMGITVHYGLEALNAHSDGTMEVSKVGSYRVLTNSLKVVSTKQIVCKRIMDIAGGLVGCAITLILCIFVGPAIYIQSPGPIFFKQKRIGLNGKQFYMYKFRSMYMDAEERKKQLMEKNNIADGMMFKMDDDPRIIGSEKKDKNGNPAGIGNFIRRTSIDEFPQFFNVLKGEMSLVGTRPPTLDEWEKYDLHHRVRMSIKPGITGLWQISGRSDITDFEEVVRLDREYIQNWSIWLDFKILFKTVGVVLKHEGAK